MANTLRFKRGLVSGIPNGALGEPLFTTDTFDLYIGNGTGNTRFQKYIASGTTSQLLRGDGSLLTMPIVLTSPSNGQVLKFNGTNWVNDSDAGITGSGANGQVAFFTGATTQSGNAGLVFNGANRLTIDGGTTGYLVGPTGEMLIGEDAGGLYIGTALGVNPAIAFYYGNNNTTTHIWTNGGSTRMRLHSTGNLVLGGTTSTDNGLRFQVTGDGFFSGGLGVGGVTYAYEGISLRRNLTGLTVAFGVVSSGTIQSDVTSGAYYFTSGAKTQAATFTLGNLYHYDATQGTFGAGSTVTNQYGFFAGSSIIGATNNFGFYGNIASGTGRWNLYMNGTAANYLAGNLSIGTTSGDIFSRGDARNVVISATGASDNMSLQLNAGASGGRGAQIYMGAGGVRYFTIGTNVNETQIGTVTSTPIIFYTNNGEKMRLFADGNVGIGTGSTNAGFRLDVNGTMRVSGASTFNGAATLSINQNAATTFTISNTTSGTASLSSLSVESNASAGVFRVGKYSTTTTPYKTLNSSDGYLYNFTAGDISILNDFATGSIKMAAGGSSTAHLTIASTGAATFSSSVTAGGRILSGTRAFIEQNGSGDADMGALTGANLTLFNRGLSVLLFNASGQAIFNTNLTNGVIIQSGGINVTGAATFSLTAQAAGFISSGGTGYAVINSAANIVTALRPTGGGTNIMSTNSNGLHIAVGTQAAGDLILATNNTERIRLSSDGFFSQGNGTNPTSSIADRYIQYSADIVAGNAAPHFRTENGAVIKLYQQDNSIAAANFVAGIGTSVTTLDAFDGYTIGQVVRALRNAGILS